LVLWFLPTISEAKLAAVHFILRKLGHFTEYAILAYLARRAFVSSSYGFLRLYWFQWALGLVVAYALLDEFHQSFVPSRTASIYDSVIDIAGGIAILLFMKLFRGGMSSRLA
jgi:VanZ family protein